MKEDQCGVDHQAHDEGIAHRADPRALAERDPKQQQQQTHPDHHPPQGNAQLARQPLMKDVPGAEAQARCDDHRAAHAEQDQPDVEIEEPAPDGRADS